MSHGLGLELGKLSLGLGLGLGLALHFAVWVSVLQRGSVRVWRILMFRVKYNPDDNSSNPNPGSLLLVHQFKLPDPNPDPVRSPDRHSKSYLTLTLNPGVMMVSGLVWCRFQNAFLRHLPFGPSRTRPQDGGVSTNASLVMVCPPMPHW